MCGIYRILCIKTNKCYVGQTKDFNRRKNSHFGLLNRNKSSHIKLQRAWNKYGEENFEFEILENIDINLDNLKDILTIREQYWMNYYDSYNNGYNSTPMAGLSTLGYRYSKESKEKISRAAKGRIISDDTKRKISESLKNRIFTEEHRKKLSEKSKIRMQDSKNRFRLSIISSGIDRSGENNNFYGRNHSEESKRKMSESMKKHLQDNPCSEDLRKKRSENTKGENNPMYGRKRTMSEESRKKMSEGQKLRWSKKKSK